ncbi:hypothetical protein [Mycolicibacterium vaccae]|nr:hypothetical protein [Mycolicibacterium vaccae]
MLRALALVNSRPDITIIGTASAMVAVTVVYTGHQTGHSRQQLAWRR